MDDLRKGSRPGRRLDPGAHGVEIDPDRSRKLQKGVRSSLVPARKPSRRPGRQPGLTAISAASDTRLLLPPVTRTTGVWPRRPQVRPTGGLKP